MKDIHIGSIIKKVLDEKSMSVTAFADKIHRERTTIYSIFKRKSIDTDLLHKISKVLDYDFLREVYLPESATATTSKMWFAPLIKLPDKLPSPHKTLFMLLNFIEIITFFRQYQKETTAGTSAGEILTQQPRPDDIEQAFAALRNALHRQTDGLSASSRDFYNWLQKYLAETQADQFTVLDVCKAKRIPRRTLNRYLQELCMFHYIQIAGGNKHREGYQYEITHTGKGNPLNKSIESALRRTLESIKVEYAKRNQLASWPGQLAN